MSPEPSPQAPITAAHLAPDLIREARRFGITRLADLTGLDRVGIPVAQAVRPDALSNAVAQGKGRSLAEASVSAILETAETFFAEKAIALENFTAAAGSFGVACADYNRHLRTPSGDWRSRKLAWTWGTDLSTGLRCAVPLELVHTCYMIPPLPTDGVFLATTTGLAAGLDSSAAILHGVLECIERDAIARAQRMHGFFHDARVDTHTIASDDVQALLEQVTAADLLVGLWFVEGAGGIPVIWCQLLEGGAQSSIMPYASDGFAAHPDPGIAICNAMIEAAQSRLAAISGARDDITRAAYPARPDWRRIEASRRLLRDGRRPIPGGDLFGRPAARIQATLESVLGALAAGPNGRTIAVHLGEDSTTGVHAVRVVCPDLEPLLE